ncbi:MAG: GNAT family acetyltransferase [Pseudomonadales bacterium]
MDIREFREADEDAVIALWRSCGLVVPHNNPHKDIARKLQVGRDLFLVGTEGEAIVASVMGGYEGHRGWVNYLAVSPDHQRKGYGEILMRKIEALLLQRGCPKINLQVRRSNDAVISFYQAIGYGEDPVASMGKRLEPDV